MRSHEELTCHKRERCARERRHACSDNEQTANRDLTRSAATAHGCVRIAPQDARWLYYWTPIGTPVWIH
ncbi:MAG: L,D-transpeptidase [Actinomycetota bacterium]